MHGLTSKNLRASPSTSRALRNQPSIYLTLLVVFASLTLASPSRADDADSGATKELHKAMRDKHAQGPDPFNRDEALRVSQAAIGRPLSEAHFTNIAGEPVALTDYRGQPLLINLIYTSCVHTCPLIVESLERSVKIARDALGDESFRVVTIGFDTRLDTPTQMKAYAHTRGVRVSGWDFLSTDEQTVASLAKELGFIFVAAPHGYDHLAQVSVVDEEGVVYRQIYGVELSPPTVVEPLKQLVFGRKSSMTSFNGLMNQVKLFCTIYNPASDKYRFDYSLIVGMVIGFLSLTGIAVVLVRGFMRLNQR